MRENDENDPSTPPLEAQKPFYLRLNSAEIARIVRNCLLAFVFGWLWGSGHIVELLPS